MRAGTEKTRAVDHVGFAFDQRVQEDGILRGIVFEIGVLNDDIVTGGFLNAATECGALAHVAGLKQYTKLWMLSMQIIEDIAGAVG